MVKKTTIKGIILVLLTLSTVASFFIYFGMKREVIPAAEKHLSSLTKTKTQQIIDFFNSQETKLMSSKSIENFIFTPSNKSASELPPNVGDSVSRVRMTLAPDISTFALNPKTNQPEIYISFPYFKDQKFQGILSAQINTEEVYQLIRDPKGLGESGEIALFEETVTNDLVLVAPLRYDPTAAFKKQSPVKEASFYYQNALDGITGAGQGVDAAEISCIAAWSYIPEVNWGIAIKMNLDEILKPIQIYQIIFYILLPLTAAYLLYVVFTSRQFLQAVSHEKAKNLRSKVVFAVLSILTTISSVLLAFFIYVYLGAKEQAFEQMQNKAQIQAEKISQSLNYDLYRVQTIGKAIADDLSHGRLTQDGLTRRMEIDLKENYQLFGLLVSFISDESNPQSQPYAAESIRKPGNVIEFNDLKIANVEAASGWYLQPLQHGETWLSPHMDPIGKQLVGIFAAPFYKAGSSKPIGTVFALYDIEQLQGLGPSLQVSDTSYGFIISQKGTFIYHPTESYVFEGRKIFDIAHQMGSESLTQIAQKAVQGQKGFESFSDPQTGQTFWVYYLPIPTAHWELGIVINQAEIIPPLAQLQQYYFNIILAATVTLITLFGLVCGIHTGKHHLLRIWSPLTCLILGLSITGFWLVVQRTSVSTSQEGVIIDKIQLGRFLSDMKQNAIERNQQAPIAIPTGIFIYTLEFPDSNHITFSGYVWQRYNDSVPKEIERDIVFPEALAVEKKEAYRDKQDGVETIGWKVTVSAPQEIDYGKYPIDVIRTTALMQHKNVDKNVILIPDLDGYSNMRPNAKPGLSSFFSLHGYEIKNTFFRVQAEKSMTNFGIESQQRNENLTNLIYNIQLERDILEALIVYLLPMFVGLVAMYVTFWIINRASATRELLTTDILAAITIYTALIFALILLHTALRSRFITGSVLYLEYFFFTTYFTTFVLINHSLIMYGKLKLHKTLTRLNPYFHIHFWQFQFLLWFLVTVFIFY